MIHASALVADHAATRGAAQRKVAMSARCEEKVTNSASLKICGDAQDEAVAESAERPRFGDAASLANRLDERAIM